MLKSPGSRQLKKINLLRHPCRPRPRSGSGFTLVELLLGASILAFGLLALASMFSAGYTDVSKGSRLTMTSAAARQIIEDTHLLPFANVANLNGFDTNNAASLPANDPERTVALRWRYALAGPGTGWTFTAAQQSAWTRLSTESGAFGARGQISVQGAVIGGVASTTLWQMTVKITVPGQTNTIQLTTFISSM